MDMQALRAQLILDEGHRLDCYPDSEGLPTIGIGHLIQPQDGLHLGDTITEARCQALFDQDVAIAVATAHRLIPTFDSLPGNIQLVLTDMAFNMGYSRLSGFVHFLDALKRGNYNLAAIEMKDSTWYHQVPVRASRLIALVQNESTNVANV